MRKNIYIISLFSILILLSYISIQPLGSGTQEITESDYTMQLKSPYLDSSQFRLRKDKKFLIQLGLNGSPKALFEIEKNTLLDFYFAISNDSHLDSMRFIIKKNSEPQKELIALKGKLNKIELNIKQGDKIEIYSDTIATSMNDWAILKIETKESLFILKNFAIPLVWIILLILFYFRGYLSLFTASYLSFLLMVFAEKLNFGSMTFDTLMIYISLSLLFTAVAMILYQLSERSKFEKLIACILSLFFVALLALPLLSIIYVWSFQKGLSKEILYAVFQTNSEESYEFISTFISLEYILATIAVLATVFILHFIQTIPKREHISNTMLLVSIALFSVISSSNFQYLKLPNLVLDELANYKNELRLFRELKEKRENNKIEFNASKKEKGETHVVVIGESLNKNHMGLYGYLRETTPNLSKMEKEGNLLVFDSVYSNHVNTALVLEYALTEANQYNQKRYYNSLSIIEVLKKADIETYWLSNQVLYGAWDNAVSVIGTTAKHVVSINRTIGKDTRTQKLDDALIKELVKILETKSDKNRVIFVHLIGNHFNYLNRYPKEGYSHYQGDLMMGEYGLRPYTNSFINSYDNSVRYNDFVITSMLKELQKNVAIGTFLYMPDHAEDIIGMNGHNVDKFTFDMTQIPMVAWVSKGYKRKYKDRYNNLENHQSTLFSNDMLYDTMIGMFGIKTDNYNSKYDFSSKDYTLEDEDALVLQGKKHYLDASNYFYWQKSNTQYLIDRNQSSRIFPHRVNSIGKLKDIWSDGFRAFEVDIRFGDNNSTLFKVGHDIETQGVSLEEFISSVDYNKIDKIWLDLKNLDSSNYTNVLQRVEYLDEKYQLKSKAIVESPTKEKFFNILSQKGWHTSYYLPTTKIVKLLQEKPNKKELQNLSTTIAKQIKEQNVLAISFDDRVYPFVKRYLEPKIPKSIIYHTWYGPNLFDTHFQYKLQNNQLFKDARIKTILSKYISHFSL